MYVFVKVCIFVLKHHHNESNTSNSRRGEKNYEFVEYKCGCLLET